MGFKIYRTGETELINGCLKGDRTSQQKVYDIYSPKMYAICCRYLRDPMQAEDALVTAFTRILEKISQYSGEGSFEGWMKTIVIREALTILRKNQLRFETGLEENENRIPAQTWYDPLDTEDLLKMIHQLPPGYRTVFNLYAIDGYAHKEIAAQLGISENTSKSQLSRARTYLQQLLAKQDIIQRHKKDDITTR
ncbi:MAG TPA: sigma-70 family RNA polymerase sigma factor [Saprospiraceae bacterium]|nr:sigma-70 family RNA polymerase sigma factor [Saprospiraceae bacterium]